MSKIIRGRTRCGVPIFKPEAPITGRDGKNGEALEALDFYKFAMYEWPHLGRLLFHVTNEGKRSKVRGDQLKRSGLIPGVSDYILLVPSSQYSYFALELKREDGGSGADKNQREFLRECIDAGGYGCIAYGFMAALHALELYLNNKLV